MKGNIIAIGFIIFAIFTATVLTFHPSLNEGCHSFEECYSQAEENMTQYDSETLPDCTDHPWYACPYPLHIIGSILLGTGIIFTIVGFVLHQKEGLDED